MSVYIDTHQGTELSNDLRRMVAARIASGEKDRFGVVDRGFLIDREAGEMHCVLEAPDVNAIMKHHESLNVPVGKETIHRAEAILR